LRHVFNIYQTDLKNIVGNWAAMIVILGLAFLPSLYAWFNIKASWDPYGQTGNLQVAVVNEDVGTEIRDHSINIGYEIIQSLKENRNIGWVFTDRDEALDGVKHGRYYASIFIPADFSRKIGTVLSDNPIKAEIIYHVNEKLNAIAPKITEKGASTIVARVTNNFIKTANGTIFEILNEIGTELEAQRPSIEESTHLILKIEGMIPEVRQIIRTLEEDMAIAEEIISRAQNNLTEISARAKKYQDFAAGVKDWTEKGSNAFVQAALSIKSDFIFLRETGARTQLLSGMVLDVNMDPTVVREALDQTSGRLSREVSAVENLTALLEKMNELAGENRLGFAVGNSNGVKDILSQQLSIVNQMKVKIDQGENAQLDLANRLNELSGRISKLLAAIINNYDSQIIPQVQQGLEKMKSTAGKAAGTIQDAGNEIPHIQKMLSDAQKGAAFGSRELAKAVNRLPAIESKIKKLADAIRRLEAEGSLDQLIDLLKNNAEKEAEFFAEPVLLKEIRLFPIPNYGSAMSPFFTTLSLWVGALLLVSLLTVEVHNGQMGYKSNEIYIGRFLTFLTLAVLQSLFVTFGNIFLIGTYVADKGWFIIFGMLLSSVFMLIVYTLVSVFGNVGKAAAIVLLVLQLAGSGGTFPIQVTPLFFQVIHPLLPFTYAISMMREAAGGILWDVVWHDLLYLSCFAVIALLLGLTLKSLVNRTTEGIVRKAKASKLIH